MKSIRQLATEIGVSKTAINKKIDTLGVRNRLQKYKNRWLIPPKIEAEIKESFRNVHQTTTNSETKSELVVDLVSVLREQLEAKDRQIAQLQALIDQEQQLRMVAEKKLLLQAPEPVKNEEPPKRWWHIFK